MTGGCGYIGSALIPYLLAQNHEVTTIDTQWFGDGFLPQDNEYLTNIKEDLRDADILKAAISGAQAVIHLAGMTNDNACRENPEVAKSINVDAFQTLMTLALSSGIRRFIFPSSSAAYGNTEKAVTETHPLSPTTPYGLYKKACEDILRYSEHNQMKCYILRPGGVFGYAPRMRFDLMVNMMTAHAALRSEINVAGGEQIRPHVHIRDLMQVINRLLTVNIHIPSGIFNVVHENQSVIHTAYQVRYMVSRVMNKNVRINITERTDDRSYAIDGAKLKNTLLFNCRRNIHDGMAEVCRGFQRGQWPDALENKAYKNLP